MPNQPCQVFFNYIFSALRVAYWLQIIPKDSPLQITKTCYLHLIYHFCASALIYAGHSIYYCGHRYYEGEYKQLAETFTRLVKALALSIVLLYFMLVVTFRSFLDPIAIMLTLPLAVIGAAFGVLLGGKFMSMPAIMGLILLILKTAVKNTLIMSKTDIIRRSNGFTSPSHSPNG